MPYLSVFIPQQPTKPIVVVDLNKPERTSVIDAIFYCDFHGGHAFISNYRNVFTAKFDRRADTGEIKLHDIPERIEASTKRMADTLCGIVMSAPLKLANGVIPLRRPAKCAASHAIGTTTALIPACAK